MDIAKFDYDLPAALIAQSPVANRSQSRLLNVENPMQDLVFNQVTSLLRPGDLIITNNTKVIAARLQGRKPTGGKVEIMLEQVLDTSRVLAMLKSSKAIKTGQQILIGSDVEVSVLGRHQAFFELAFSGLPVQTCLEKYGQLPLPPYIKRAPQEKDDQRYQTVYAREPGAVAAPTAGLHFDEDLLNEIQRLGVQRCELTLHVGAGTFQPVRVQNIKEHKMHQERYEINEQVVSAIARTREQGGRVVAVGTTTVRALESAYVYNQLKAPCNQPTEIFIYPGFEFKVVDALITNFHLPKSTLLMMVSAFAGYETIMQAYQHAIAKGYRFFSYGDAMFLNNSNPRDST